MAKKDFQCLGLFLGRRRVRLLHCCNHDRHGQATNNSLAQKVAWKIKASYHCHPAWSCCRRRRRHS